MALYAFLELALLAGIALGHWEQATEQCGPADSVQLRHHGMLCPLPLDDDASSNPTSWGPWTHRPYCASSAYCVYTNSRFHGSSDYGVSFISTPEVAASSLDALHSSFSMPLAVIRDTNGTGSAAYRVVDIPGKGKGVVAGRKINRGSVFMVDYASIIAAVEFPEKMPRFQGHMLLERAVEQLPDPQRVLSLARSSSADRAVMEDVMRTNSFSITLNDIPWMGLFPQISRINHACKPNAHTRFSQRFLTMSAVSLRDIEPGEEINISYAEFGTAYGQRQHSLLHNWGFRCTCALCTAPSDELVASDRRRGRIGDIRQEVVELVQEKQFDRAISMSKEMIDLVLKEELVAHLGEHYEVLARMYYAVWDRDNTAKYARLAIADLEQYGGEEVYGATIGELKKILLGLEQQDSDTRRD